MDRIELYRGFSIYANSEDSIITGNSPRELYKFHKIECGGVTGMLTVKEPVNFKAYQGGYNPVYGESIEKVKQKIDNVYGPTCEECGKSIKLWCECHDHDDDENTNGEHRSVDRDDYNYDEYN